MIALRTDGPSLLAAVKAAFEDGAKSSSSCCRHVAGASTVESPGTEFSSYVQTELQKLTVQGGPRLITFPAALSGAQRKTVHQMAQHQGFLSSSQGEGTQRRISVYRPGASDAPTQSAEHFAALMPKEEHLSRRLASLLRHRAHEHHLKLAEDGYARLAEVLALPMFEGVTPQEVEDFVGERDEKKRFHLVRRGGEAWIRANQGHTIRTVKDEKLLEPILRAEDVPCCVHGTYLDAWEGIKKDGGISKMSRNHIHFAPQPPGEQVLSGVRSDCEVAIYVSVASAMADGLQFFRSANNVILTRGDSKGKLLHKHFLKAVRLEDGLVLWPLPAEPVPPLPPLPPAEAGDPLGDTASSDEEVNFFPPLLAVCA